MDDDQQFCLRWNNHQSTLVAVFDTLLENGTLVDCTLAAEGKFLNAHKVVLSACSPYFEALLSRHYDKHPILILKDVKFQELKAMMDYMYRGEVNISQDQLGALLKAAESLQIKGLSDNKKDEPAKRPAPAPAPPKSPQPQTQLPKVQGLTIEQRSRDDREGSMSPGPRKKKRMRRKSEDMDNHDASNSSDAHSLPPQNIPSATSQISTANVKMNSSDLPDTIETKQEILTRHKDETGPQQQVPMIKEKLETHTELMLEPKSEYVEEMNEDSIEDLTLDDDDMSNMEQVDDGAGPSHGGEGSSQQGFGHWQMGNQSQDEVFLAAQEAVGAHRDSQGAVTQDSKKRRRAPSLADVERRPSQISGYFTSNQAENQHLTLDHRPPPKTAIKSIMRNQDFSSGSFSSTSKPEKFSDYDRPQSKDAGLLTDSLSCIFTRRPKRNNQHKTPQKRVFFEEVREEHFYDDQQQAPDAASYPVEELSSCPRPPSISRKDDSSWTEIENDADAPPDMCPEPPLISRDREQALDISNAESNVSPYIPKNRFEQDEYSKYKTQQLEKEPKYKQMLDDVSLRYQTVQETEDDDYEELSKYDIASYAMECSNESRASKENPSEWYQEGEPAYNYNESFYDTSAFKDKDMQSICPEAPHISTTPSEKEAEVVPPEPPTISDTQRPYYDLVASTKSSDTSKKCHRCSFETNNAKRLKDHLKFVHGETGSNVEVEPGSKKSNELFSRREPKPAENHELFSRRQYTAAKTDYVRRDDVSGNDGTKKCFKRRNTAVNIISSNVIVPAKKDSTEIAHQQQEATMADAADADGQAHDSGVLAAMEYFENSKDQLKKNRPYKRNDDELLDDDWL